MSYRPLRIIDAVPPMEDWPPMAARLGGNRAIIFREMDENGKIHEKMKEFKPGWMSLMFEGQVYDWYGKRAKVCPDEQSGLFYILECGIMERNKRGKKWKRNHLMCSCGRTKWMRLRIT